MTQGASPVALAGRKLSANLGGRAVLHDVSVQLRAGRWTSIVGPNGAGKSTLLKVLAGLLPHTGHVELLGKPLADYRGRERAQALAWLGQNEAVADDLTVSDVVMLGRLPHQAWLAQPDARDIFMVERSLKATQAWEWRDRRLGELAGGERQRALLARALAVDARVYLMDEPLTNLDPPHQSDWLCVAQSLVEEGCTVVSVLHEITMALHADDMLVMQDGCVRHEGACNDPATHRALEAVFDHRLAIHSLGGQWLALPCLPPERR